MEFKINKNLFLTNKGYVLTSFDKIQKGDWYLFFLDGFEFMECQDDAEAERCNTHYSIKDSCFKILATEISSTSFGNIPQFDLITNLLKQKEKVVYTEEDIKKAYIQGGFDSNSIARMLYPETKSFKNVDEYLEHLTPRTNLVGLEVKEEYKDMAGFWYDIDEPTKEVVKRNDFLKTRIKIIESEKYPNGLLDITNYIYEK